MKTNPQTSVRSTKLGEFPQVESSGLDEGDRSQIRAMMRRTPTERLAYLQEMVDAVQALRDGRVREPIS